MKKFLMMLVLSCVVLLSCDKEDNSLSLRTVAVQVSYPQESNVGDLSNVKVTLSSANTTYEEATNGQGIATFTVPDGVYDVTVSDTRTINFNIFNYNGLLSGLVVNNTWNADNVVKLNLTESKASQIIIKEVFVGGSVKDDNSGAFAFDKYITLYNNSDTDADLKDLCIAIVGPFNAQASNPFYNESGKLMYEDENWIPAIQGYWYFANSSIIKARETAVVAVTNAVDNTVSYSRSINFANPSYYAMYDPTKYTNASYYVAPASVIPSSHYLKAETYSPGNAWSISVSSPGVFIFKPEGTTPSAFAADASKTYTINAATVVKKVPTNWILDAVEVYIVNNTNNKKRFTSAVDAGYVYHENNKGYSVYRNVDKAATEAILTNQGKLVYNYSLGTTSLGSNGSTDESNIDAEASIKNGAKIVYQDSNNSTKDFHLRIKAALSNK